MSESVSGSTISTNTHNRPNANSVGSGRGGAGRGNSNTSGGGDEPTQGGRGCNRNNRRQKQDRNQAKTNTNISRSSFKGNTPELNGHVFECYDESRDRTQFPKTIEILGQYASKTLKFPEDIRPMFKEPISTPTIPVPTDIGDSASKLDKALWDDEVKAYRKRRDSLRSNMRHLFDVIWGQCSKTMQSKLRTLDDFDTETEADNCVWLLKNIKAITHHFDTEQDIFYALHDARTAYINCKQRPDQSNTEYQELFRSTVEVLEFYGAEVAESKTLIKDVPGQKAFTDDERKTKARDRTLAMAFLKNSDPGRYAPLLADQKTNTTVATTNTQKTSLVPIKAQARSNSDTSTSTTTNPTMGSPVPSSVPPPDSTATPSPRVGFSCLQYGMVLTQTDIPAEYPIPKEWVLLDSQSTISVFNNANLVTDIRPSPTHMFAFTNGGHQTSTHIATVHNLGTVWYNPASVANILSLSQMRNACRVTMDSSLSPSITVHRLDGTTMIFHEQPDGLYAYDTGISPPATDQACTLVHTVATNKSFFTQREITAADDARSLYRLLGRPSQHQFESILAKNLVTNCPVTVDDAKRALLIYGPDIAALKGKTPSAPALPRVPDFSAVPIPATILTHHSSVTLCLDFFYVQGLCFLHSVSRKLQYRTVHPVQDRSATTIRSCLDRILSQYRSRGFTVHMVLADVEFECIRDAIAPTLLDTVPPEAHVGEVERSIRTIKERIRSTVHGLPFKYFPKTMVVELVQHAIICLNQFPVNNGLSDTLSPNTIMTGKPNPDYNKLRIEFGSYAQIFEPGTITSNTMRSRTTGAIALTTTGNTNGHMFFLSLATGRKLSRAQWTELPMPEEAILRLEEIAKNEGQPIVQNARMIVEWRPEEPFDDSDDPDYVYDGHNDDGDHTLDTEDYEWDEFQTTSPEVYVTTEDPGAHNLTSTVEHHDDTLPAIEEDTELDQEEPEDDLPDEDMEDTLEDDSDANVESVDDTTTEEEATPATHTRWNLRPSRQRSYDHRLDHQMDNPPSNKSYDVGTVLFQRHVIPKAVTGLILTQMSAAKGIKLFGQPAKDALMKELKQLHDKKVFTPRARSELTYDERKNALRAVNLVKEKRSGELKGRTCADGSKQRGTIPKSQTSSPTVSNDALMCTLIIDAQEGRDVATADVVGAYLNADMDDFVLLKLTGEVAQLMTLIDPSYESYITVEHNVPTLYLELEKALYGCVQSAFLWYKLFSRTLQKMGFELNPYDPCVANKVINGKQCTIVWYVDDTKISHKDPIVVTEIVKLIEDHFGKMTVTRGSKHTFLGMDIEINNNHTVSINMKNHLKESVSDSGLSITKCTSSPAQKNLFNIDHTSTKLNEQETDIFHSTVAKLLYISLRARPDLLLATSFLCTRVAQPTKQDQQKLKRLLAYITGTMDLKLSLGADDLRKVNTWVDASFATHDDMKSHTGGLISFGIGGIMCKSSKQKLNTKSSTEAEVVGVSDYISNTIWLRMFLEAKGLPLCENLLAQDNESAIKLELNGRQSAGRQSRHIDIRYFFIKDRLTSENMKIYHCPTDIMIADFFTKPLQGKLFVTFRDVILGYVPVSALRSSIPSVPEERVGNNEGEQLSYEINELQAESVENVPNVPELPMERSGVQ